MQAVGELTIRKEEEGWSEGRTLLHLVSGYVPQVLLPMVTVGEHWSGEFPDTEPVQSAVAVTVPERIQMPPPRLILGSLKARLLVIVEVPLNLSTAVDN